MVFDPGITVGLKPRVITSEFVALTIAQVGYSPRRAKKAEGNTYRHNAVVYDAAVVLEKATRLT
jgi:hypothetical protein